MHAFTKWLRTALAAAIIATFAAPASAADPHILRETETGSAAIPGIWSWDDTKKVYAAKWENGAKATIRLVKNKDGELEFERIDSNGGLTARYFGTKSGNTVRGTVEWNLQGKTWTGTWEAKEERVRADGAKYAAVLAPGEATEVFNRMAAQKDIAFKYAYDGCYARAHLMVVRMRVLGIRPGKVWAFAPDGQRLDANGLGVEWQYHVAPTIRVRYSDGERDVVIDPSLSNRPITVDQWRNTMIAADGRRPIIRQTRIGEAPVNARGEKCPGTGYSIGLDPYDMDANSRDVMARAFAKLNEGVLAPR